MGGDRVPAGQTVVTPLLDGWEPGEHPELGELVTRVAGSLLIDTSQLERLMSPRAAAAAAG